MKTRLRAVLTMLATVATVGCTTHLEPTSQNFAPDAPNFGKGQNGNGTAPGLVAKLLWCTPQPVATTTMVVGPGGATIWAGYHRLKIPAGALSSQVQITMVAPSEAAAVVDFSPHGLEFNPGKAATLTMSLGWCEIPPVANIGIKYVTPENVILESLKSQWNGRSGTIAAPLTHFSRYAVAW